jgi:type IV pilus assembly protein PilZ
MPYKKKDRREGAEPIARDRRRSGADRRQYQRILIDLEVDYQCEETFLFAYITDMSALGIFIRTNNPEPPGTHLNLRFTLPGDEKPLELEGEVIWINAYRPGSFESINPGMGVQFIDVDHELKDRLLALVRKIAYLDEEAPTGDDDDDEDDDDDTETDDIPVTVDPPEEPPDAS